MSTEDADPEVIAQLNETVVGLCTLSSAVDSRYPN